MPAPWGLPSICLRECLCLPNAFRSTLVHFNPSNLASTLQNTSSRHSHPFPSPLLSPFHSSVIILLTQLTHPPSNHPTLIQTNASTCHSDVYPKGGRKTPSPNLQNQYLLMTSSPRHHARQLLD